jgi:hypothetical protein
MPAVVKSLFMEWTLFHDGGGKSRGARDAFGVFKAAERRSRRLRRVQSSRFKVGAARVIWAAARRYLLLVIRYGGLLFLITDNRLLRFP